MGAATAALVGALHAARLRWRRVRRGDEDGERGQVMLLSLACVAFALAMILVVASASAVYLERKALFALADAAAADAADAFDTDEYFGAGEPALTDASVRTSVEEFLASAPGVVVGDLEDLAAVGPTGAADPTTAQVTLTARARPPFLPWALMPWADGIPLRVTVFASTG
ncbi:hypothetical protein Bcav_2785 [Beutenbergia cavernae DSM 12333]|uniref:Uncharacterized protein n=1 Tax=Beutenbergia cavernae (strain ATCC BAA-8 / DSM 12333 / CCUG 43141 / JCM 11478 / NBRC 16432 / NCIMB 13614 / HKI 0122) TaxID=471853 RepID=C5BYD0_BEUC1|nr:hypothetical protein [Beutenbergia cavernae]ACQ81030.1 hypothetical protein Bcav_2785 [Beutenbergia cavernae DSM 12333]